MKYKQFGNTDMNVSALTVGTWAIGGANWGDVNKQDSIKAIRTMLDCGVNSIDTAPGYNFGESERIVGEAIKGRRDNVYITTKTGVYNDKKEGFVKDCRKETVLRLCDESLKNLQTDYIDLMIIHWPDINYNTPFSETMYALNSLKKAGKIRYIGVSNFDKEQITEVRKFGDVVAIQPPYSMVNRSQEELMKWTSANGMANMTYGSLGAGILTGAIRELPNLAPDDMRFVFYDFFKEPKFSKVMQLLKVLDIVAAERNATVAQVAVHWNSQKDFVNTSLCGVRNAEEAIENCKGFEWNLSDEEMKMIDKAIDTYL
jgi:aryl-alcohol dehydrogenase-like predicted oxidoreductase